MIHVKRVYEQPFRADGLRVLVDRLWPRGLTKERAKVKLWLKDLAPSTELRKWFDHDPAKWKQFQSRFRAELRAKRDVLDALKQKIDSAPSRCFMASDEKHNHALVLKMILEGRKS